MQLLIRQFLKNRIEVKEYEVKTVGRKMGQEGRRGLRKRSCRGRKRIIKDTAIFLGSVHVYEGDHSYGVVVRVLG
jgi:hypothetical protein